MTTDYKVQVSYNLPPIAQYTSGNMLNVRGDSVAEVSALILEAAQDPFMAPFIEAGERVLSPAEVAKELDASVEQSNPHKDYEGCPQCGEGNLVEKTRKDGKGTFMGCDRFPACNYIKPRAK